VILIRQEPFSNNGIYPSFPATAKVTFQIETSSRHIIRIQS
jgi:hypothetical protein